MTVDDLRRLIPADRRHLVDVALTHPSFANEAGGPDQGRLEFLGDAVLKLALSQLLYERFPEESEADLTLRRIAIENGVTLAALGKQLGVQEAIRTGKGERSNVAADKRVEDTVEALIGALYLGAGFGPVRPLVSDWFGHLIDQGNKGPLKGPKNLLQEYAAAHKLPEPVYTTLDQVGPGHQLTHHCRVQVGEIHATAVGSKKKEAEANAARLLLALLTGAE